MTFKETVVGALAKLRATTESPTARRNMKRRALGAAAFAVALTFEEMMAGCGVEGTGQQPGASATPTPIDAKPSAGPVPDGKKYLTDESYALYLWQHQNDKNLDAADKSALASLFSGNPAPEGDVKFDNVYKSGYYDVLPKQTTVVYSNLQVDKTTGNLTGHVDFGFVVNNVPYSMSIDGSSTNVDGKTLISDFHNYASQGAWDNLGSLGDKAVEPQQIVDFFSSRIGKGVILGIGVPNIPNHPEAVNMLDQFKGAKELTDWLKGVKGAKKPDFVAGPASNPNQVKPGAVSVAVFTPWN